MRVYLILIVYGVACAWNAAAMGQTGRAARYQPGDWVNYANFHYVTSFEEGDRYLYIGTTHGVLRYNQVSEQWEYPYTRSSGLANDYVLNIIWVKDNRELWVITRGGIDVIYTVLDRWTHIPDSENILGPALQDVRVGQTAQSVVLMPAGGNSYAFNKYSYTLQGRGLPGNDVQWKEQQRIRGNMPIYFLNESWHINRINNSLVDEEFREFPFTVQYTTSFNRVYLGTWGGGFIRADATARVGEVVRFGPISTPVGAISKDAENFWFGSALAQLNGPADIYGQPGISRWDLRRDRWDHLLPEDAHAFRNAQIYSLDGDGQKVWVGTNRGLLYYNFTREEWFRFDKKQLGTSPIFDIVVTDTTVWVATDIGLYNIAHPQGYIRYRTPILEDEMLSVYSIATNQGQLFAGTEYGLINLDIGQKKIYFYNTKGQQIAREKFRFRRVYQVTSSRDRLYYADHVGIHELNQTTARLTQLPKLGLLAKSSVRVIETDGRTLWVGFDDGAGEYDISNGEWEFYTGEDGLGENLVYDIIVEQDYVWFATQNGVTRFRKTTSESK